MIAISRCFSGLTFALGVTALSSMELEPLNLHSLNTGPGQGLPTAGVCRFYEDLK